MQIKLDAASTYASTISITSVRLMVAIEAALRYNISSLDVSNAFVTENLHEEIYTRLPVSFTGSKDRRYVRLIKSLYGLTQAPATFQRGLHTHLETQGFTASQHVTATPTEIPSSKEIENLTL